MEPKKTLMCGLLAASLAVMLAAAFTACEQPVLDSPSAARTGSITGRALFTNSENNSGIAITLEKTDGLRSVSVNEANRNIAAGARSIDSSRSVARQTQTAADGSFTLHNITAGMYVLYATSQNSLEKAITTSVTVRANEVFDAGTLNLTPVGSISGQIVIADGNTGDALGFLVNVAGTSFMAVTDINGCFTINGIPAGDGYFFVVTRGNYTGLYTVEAKSVSGGITTFLGTKNINKADLAKDSEIIIGENGNWYINGEDTGISAKGEKGDTGENGKDGISGATPHIGPNGNWWIGATDTGIKAQGKDGVDGTPGKDGESGKDGTSGATPHIGANGNWWIGATDTGIKAQGKDGVDGTPGKDGESGKDGTSGATPHIGPNGNWWIGATDTGVKAQGKDGVDGTPGTPGSVVTIVGGYWYIDGVNTGIPVQGPKGDSGKDGTHGSVVTIVGGNWYIDGVDTGIPVQGPKGDSGTNGKDGTHGSVVAIVSGNWYIDGVNTGIPVQGPKGDSGKDGSVVTIVSGYWHIDGVDTGIPVQGPKGDSGKDGSVVTIVGGYWYVDGVTTGIKAQGSDGATPHIGANGNWWIGTTDTGVKAQGKDGVDGTPGKDGESGKDGTNGATPHIGVNGNWWIGTIDTGVKAQGPQSEAGTNGNTGGTDPNQTPVASDYTIGNLNQTAGNVTAVTITANSGKSPGAITNIRYDGSTTIPQTAGTYHITFDVATTTGWNAANGLAGGILTIIEPLGITLNIAQIIDQAPIYNHITLSRNNTGFPVTYTVYVNASDFDAGSIKWEVAGVGINSGQTITGDGSSFTLNAGDVRYNSLGGHTLTLTVAKSGLQYRRAITFTIIQ